jgi:hypothetical protein
MSDATETLNQAAPEAPQAAPETGAPTRYETFEEFYPFYLSEHRNQTSRRLHVIGTGLAILCLTQVAMWGLVGGFKWLLFALIVGYGFAWVGHYVFEKNEPATFKYPAFSLRGDVRMFLETVTGKRAF